jgi:predicted Fe-S protein YdhL (DUF1289 family)
MELPAALVRDLTRRARSAQTAQPVPSPCRNVCHMDAASGYCEGCLRTIEEIAGWSAMAEDDKRRIWAQLPQRAAWLAG